MASSASTGCSRADSRARRGHVAAHPGTTAIGDVEPDLLPGTDLDAELERVDAALYRAKDEGRNRAVAAA